MKRTHRKIEHMNARDYSFVGISSIFDKFVDQEGEKFFGRTFTEIVCVLKSGQFFHGEAVGDRVEVPKAFLQKVNKDSVDLEKVKKDFLEDMRGYKGLLKLPTNKYDLQTIHVFYGYYRVLLDPAYAVLETLDVIDTLNPEKREGFEKWAIGIRTRAESIYKDGEGVFIPKYLKWLAKNHLPQYKPGLLSFLFFQELIDFTEGKTLPSVSELEDRQQCCYLSQFPYGKHEILGGREAEEMIEKRKLFGDIGEGVNEVKGQQAYPGKVSGKVRIIYGAKDMKKFKDGEIIVASMTVPAFLPIMKKALAFVTDEGGVLCHAAIVAREMKKPCIIGTKYATQVFKDGDVVEVDAEKGVVRKI